MKSKITLYCDLIKKFNRKLNLISPKDMHLLESKHISDAEESFRIFMDIYGHSNGYPAYDLGSGNGTPGVVWAILNPERKYTLVEIDQRKSEFLRHCKRELGLSNLEILNADFKSVHYNPDSILIARAFMNLNNLLAVGSSVRNYKCFLLKGSTWNNELAGIEDIMFKPHHYVLKDGTLRNLLEYSPN